MKTFLQNGFVVRPIENGGKLISVKIGKYRIKKRKDREEKEFNTYLQFRDSYALFQTSLKKLGSFVGLEKIEHDKEWGLELTEKDIEYCKRDCEIVFRALSKVHDFYEKIMNESIEMDKLPPTTASFAFRVFKKMNSIWSPTSEKYVCPWLCDNEYLNNFMLQNFYFGGRVELFKSEIIDNAFYYDINSLYPSVMINNTFHLPPYEIRQFQKEDLDDPKTVGFFAFVDERNENIPLLPEHFNQGLYFPAKIKKTFIFKEEYEYLKSRNIKIEIKQTMLSACKPSNPFGYLNEFYKMKNKKDSMSYFYKIILNSTYGRFGIDNEKEVCEIMHENLCSLKEEGVFPLENELEGYCKKVEKKEIMFQRNLILACKITALARLELTKWLHTLTESGIQVYYCDTDSIVCQENDILPIGKELGQFKKEHEFTWFCGLGNKEYLARIKDSNDYLVKLKGVHNANLQSLFEYHADGVSQLNVSKLKSMINKGYLDEPFNIVMIKKSRTFYHKRNLATLKPISSFKELKITELENAVIVAKAIEEIKKKVEKENEKNTN